MQVIVNGDERAVRDGETVWSLLQTLDIEASRVAIELDRKIVKRANWDATPLSNGAKLEIVQFVGGG